MTKASGSIDLKSLNVAGEPNKYITYIDSINGIRVYDSKSNGNYVNFAQLNSNGLQIYKGGTATANKIAQFGEIHVPSNNPTVTIGEVAQDKYNLWMLPKGMFIRQGSTLKHFLGDVGLYLNQYTSITPGHMKLATDNGLCFADLYSPNMKTVTQVRTFVIEEGTTKSYFSLDARFQSFSINNASFEIENPASGVTYTGEVQYASSAIAPPTQDWYSGTTYTATYKITPAISGPNSITITYTTTVPTIKFILGYEIGDRIEIDDGAMKFFKAEDISNPIVNFNKEYIQIGSINEVHTTIDTTGMSIYINNSLNPIAKFGSTITIGSTGSGKANTYIDSNGLQIRIATTPYISLNTNGLKIGQSGGEHLSITSDGINFYKGSENITSNYIATFGENTRIGLTTGNHIILGEDGLSYNTIYENYIQSIFNVRGTEEHYTPGSYTTIAQCSYLENSELIGETIFDDYFCPVCSEDCIVWQESGWDISFDSGAFSSINSEVLIYRYWKNNESQLMRRDAAVIKLTFYMPSGVSIEENDAGIIWNSITFVTSMTGASRPYVLEISQTGRYIYVYFALRGYMFGHNVYYPGDTLHSELDVYYVVSDGTYHDCNSVFVGDSQDILDNTEGDEIEIRTAVSYIRTTTTPNTTIGTRYLDNGEGYTTAIGESLISTHRNGLVIGKYNKTTSTPTAFIIGNGTGVSDSNRSNALMVDWNGNIIAQGMAGQIIMYAGSTAPTGWLFCQGQSVSRTTYATLFAVIGTTYGTGDGSTTFNLPDFRGRVGVGVGTGTAAHATTHTLNQIEGDEDAIVPYHRHASYKYTSSALGSGSVGARIYNPTGSSGDSTMYTSYAGTSGNATGANMPPYIGINYIICTGKTN